MEILQYLNTLLALPVVIYVVSLEKRLTTLNTKMDMLLQQHLN